MRIRIKGEQGFITEKGQSDRSGIKRFEWERDISVEDALALIHLCEPGIIDKTRYLIRYGAHVFEVDEFYGNNESLTMAEVELADENEKFD